MVPQLRRVAATVLDKDFKSEIYFAWKTITRLFYWLLIRGLKMKGGDLLSTLRATKTLALFQLGLLAALQTFRPISTVGKWQRASRGP